MFKVRNERELDNLLKIISEEAVSHAKRKIKEDAFDDKYRKMRKIEKSMFEQEDAPPAATEPEEDAEPAEAPTDTAQDGEQEQQAPEEQGAEDVDQKPSEESFSGSKDRLVDFVNDIRSAPSLKDSAVDEQVSAYYDRLSEEERNVLVFFLRELSRVMTGKALGSEARDPSEPPLNIQFVSGDEEEASTAETTSDAPQPEEETSAMSEPDDEAETETPEDSEEGLEDTEPPIKVNEAQDYASLRRKIRLLFQ
tara:strand:- start:4448 stop:5203 length:756 start_codon:yes stop_codon:yes gene_type:complete